MGRNLAINKKVEELLKIEDKEVLNQLLFLYVWLEKRGKEWMFDIIVHEYNLAFSSPDAEKYEQIIKCVTHNIPYRPLLVTSFVSPEQMIEVRRFMEDTNCDSEEKKNPFMFIAERLLLYIKDPHVIYEFRRFNKCEQPFSYDESLWLFLWITKNRTTWLAISAMYEVYTKKGFDEMVAFAYKYEKLDSNHGHSEDNEWDYDTEIAMWLESVGLLKEG